MTNIPGAIVGVVLICAASPLGGPMRSGSVQTARLDPRIGAAVPQRYESIRDAKDWENPYLLIRRDGIDVIVKRLPPFPRKTVAVADLERVLIGLPLAAWPYGRVAAVQDGGIRAPDRSDDKAIADNLEATLAILKKLDVVGDRWPG